MKLFIVIMMIIAINAVSINSKCAGEITKLTPRFSKLYGNVNERNIVSSIKEILGILKSLVNIKKFCSGSDGVDLSSFKQKIGDCMKGGFELGTNAYKSYNEYEEDGFSDILVDNLIEMSHFVEPVIRDCWGDDVKSVLGFVLPDQCISVMDDATKISLQIIEQKERPLLVTKGLINLQKIFKKSKKVCPFVESLIPQKDQNEDDNDSEDSENSENSENSEDYEDSDLSDENDIEALFELFE